MMTVERKNMILKMLDEQSSVSVTELSGKLAVSEVTVRKMLNDLDKQGCLRRTRGGAVSLSVALRESGEREKERQNIREKKAIARLAYDLIDDADTIYLDAGSTTLEIVKLIRNGNKRNIVVVTNTLNIVTELIDSYDINLVFIGGNVRHKIMSCVGPLAERAVEGMCFDKVFMGTNSLCLEMGVTTPNLTGAQIKRKVIEVSRQAILVCDATKFGKVTMARICPLDRFSSIITDWRIPRALAKEILDANVHLVIAQDESKAREKEKAV